MTKTATTMDAQKLTAGTCSEVRRLGGLLLAVCLMALPTASGHGYLMSPRSRNYLAAPSQEGKWSGGGADDPPADPNPHSLNRGGLCGISPLGGGTSYTLPTNAQGGPMPLKIQEIYEQGQIIDVKVILTAHHKGHFEMKACPLAAPGDVPTQDCFDEFPLEYVSDELYGTPKDNNYPGRAYIIPESDSRIRDTADNKFPAVPYAQPSGKYFHYKYKLPADLNGEIVLLQWYYVTGNSCSDEGYSQFPTAADYENQENTCSLPLDACGENTPERFWNCAEVKINKASDAVFATVPPPAGPTTLPCLAPIAPTTYSPVAAPVPTPTTPGGPTGQLLPGQRCGLTWNDANTRCGIACPVGNSDECPIGETCYADVDTAPCSSDQTPVSPTNTPVNAPTAAPVPSPPTSAPVNPQTTPAPIPSPALIATSTKRCGVSEVEAREMCSPTCVSAADCPDDQLCWGTHLTYCDSADFTPNQWYKPNISPITHRCGTSEVDARSFCKTPCTNYADCTVPGENCFAVHMNFCGSEVTRRMLRG